MRKESAIAAIKKELEQGNLKAANRLLYGAMFSRESHELLAERLGDENVTASIVMAFVRSLSFSKRTSTVCVTLRKHQVQINPDFFMEHIMTLEDLFWILLHERGHLILRILGYGELCNDMHDEFGFNTANFIEDVYINAVSRQHVRSTLPERYYKKAKSINMLLTARIDDPKEFPYEVVLMHDALYSVNCRELLKELEVTTTFRKHPGKWDDEYYFDLANSLGLTKLGISMYGKGPGGDFTSGRTTVRIDFPTFVRVMSYYFRSEGADKKSEIAIPVVGPPNKGEGEGEGEGEGGSTGESYDSDHKDDMEADSVAGSDVSLKEDASEPGEGAGEDGEEDYNPDTDELDYQTGGGEHKTSKDVNTYKEKNHADSVVMKSGNGTYLSGYPFPELSDPRSFEFSILFSLTKDERQKMNKGLSSLIQAARSINLQRVGDISGSILTNYVTEEATTFNSPTMPTGLSRKDIGWLGAGVMPVMYQHKLSVANEPYVAYMDVSGSMDRWMWIIPQLEQALQQILARVFHFSTELVEVDVNSKFYYTTGGTNYNVVVRHIISHGFKRVVIVTDEQDSISTTLQEALRIQCDDIVLISTDGFKKKNGFKSVATKAVTME